jgi:hypothetical protein
MIGIPVMKKSRVDGEKAPQSKSHSACGNRNTSLTPLPRSHSDTGAEVRMKARCGELSPSDAPDHRSRRPKSADGPGRSKNPL